MGQLKAHHLHDTPYISLQVRAIPVSTCVCLLHCLGTSQVAETLPYSLWNPRQTVGDQKFVEQVNELPWADETCPLLCTHEKENNHLQRVHSPKSSIPACVLSTAMIQFRPGLLRGDLLPAGFSP